MADHRSVIENDWMEHRGVTAACSSALQAWMAQHPERHRQARLLDLGCGDMAQMAPVFRALPLGAFVGVDLTEQVLPMAASALGDVPFTAEFHHRDVQRFVEAEGEPFDLVHASFVLHHLSDDEKARFLSTLRGRIRRDGAFLWIDVFCEPGESRRITWRGTSAGFAAAGTPSPWMPAKPSSRTSPHTTSRRIGRRSSTSRLIAAGIWSGCAGSHRAEAAALLTRQRRVPPTTARVFPGTTFPRVSMFD